MAHDSDECPICEYRTLYHVREDSFCVVCDLRAENRLLKESRSKFHDLLITAFEKLVYMGYPIEDFPGMTPDLLDKTWKQVRDHESFS